MAAEYRPPLRKAATPTPKTTAAEPAATPEPAGIAVNGYRQVLEMLRVADPEFRTSLLKRLRERDRALADNLRRELGL